MDKPIIRIHNVEVNEIIEREMDDQEFAQYQADQADAAAKEAAKEAKAQAKQAILDRLGLTAEELQTILG